MKIIFLSCLLVICAALAMAQSDTKSAVQKRPNLSGVWIPQLEKQRKPKAGPTGWTNVIIEQSEAEIKFRLVYPPDSQPPQREFFYYTNGRGETNRGMVYYFHATPGASPDDEFASTASWDGNALVVVHKIIVHTGMVTITSDLIMRWELSADGKTLTRTIKETNHSGSYVQHTAQGDKVVKLPVEVKGNTGEFKDTYLLLETKQ